MNRKKIALLCVLVFGLSLFFISCKEQRVVSKDRRIVSRDRRQREKRERQTPREQQPIAEYETQVFVNEAPASNIDYSVEKRFIGFLGVPQSEFSKAKSLGALAVSTKMQLPPTELQSHLKSAKSLGLGLIGRAEGQSRFQMGEMQKQAKGARQKPEGTKRKIDFEKLKQSIQNSFLNTNIASDPYFLGDYIIDEPCHPNKWDITVEDFKQFYATVKEVNPDINVLVNFGHLACLESFIQNLNPDEKIVDIATFTITTHKFKKSSNYIAEEADRAKRIKQAHPDIQIIPLVAIYEYPARNLPIASADWVRKTGMEVLEYDRFDGIMFYPWDPSRYMGETIADVVDDPKYSSSFKDVFATADERFGIK